MSFSFSLKPKLITPPTTFNPDQYALAIHTASPDLGLALSNFAGDRRRHVWANLGKGLSTHLHLYLAEFIQPQTWSDFAFIAVAKGPGGFTGTRLGIVTARTLAQQLKIPLFGISTLAAVARSAASIPAADSTLAVQMPAHRGEVYGAIYSVSEQEVKAVLPDAVMSQADWQQILENWPTSYQLVQAKAGLGETAVALLELAYLEWQMGLAPDWSTVLPFYGQSPV